MIRQLDQYTIMEVGYGDVQTSCGFYTSKVDGVKGFINFEDLSGRDNKIKIEFKDLEASEKFLHTIHDLIYTMRQDIKYNKETDEIGKK